MHDAPLVPPPMYNMSKLQHDLKQAQGKILELERKVLCKAKPDLDASTITTHDKVIVAVTQDTNANPDLTTKVQTLESHIGTLEQKLKSQEDELNKLKHKNRHVVSEEFTTKLDKAQSDIKEIISDNKEGIMDTIESMKANLTQLGNDLNHQNGNFKDLQGKVTGLANLKDEVHKNLIDIKSLKNQVIKLEQVKSEQKLNSISTKMDNFSGILFFITNLLTSLAESHTFHELLYKLSQGDAAMIKCKFYEYLNIVPEHFQNFNDIFEHI